ncbi:MAG: U32 family peptidase [Bacteroidaceae bacterium]|nr:U32 family peptidase [Bacteroidaceae bacterium]
MTQQRYIELLAPARNFGCGIEAINHGADAVYIGATKFGARVEAVNETDDIARLCDYAHTYGVKVYATLNTILYDDELEQAHSLALDLARAGVDALITQDMALLSMELPIPLHASTQMDNRTAEQIHRLHALGFRRAILARELSIKEIQDIRASCPDMELEAFVHGALCVSYSGRCYASQYLFGRSANRGQCAQFCRLPFDLENESGHILAKEKHLLSLKDMNRSGSLEEMMDAGICSFKIEGRLKDASYVKNITAYYRKQLDKILERRTEYVRSSYGQSHPQFDPQPRKSFNRGFTEYFLHGRTENVASIHTPKSIGEAVGKVKEVRGKTIRISGTTAFHNGDGLCYFDTEGKLQGFRVNRAENNLLYLMDKAPTVRPQTPLFRNFDAAFDAKLRTATPQRTILADIALTEVPEGYTLSLTDETGLSVTINIETPKDSARTSGRERIRTELSKLGGTGLEVRKISIHFEEERFIPASHLAGWRRRLVEKWRTEKPMPAIATPEGRAKRQILPVQEHIDCSYNVSNEEARNIYTKLGATSIESAFELQPQTEVPLMTCRHCIRHTLGYCQKHGGRSLPKGSRQLYLRSMDGRRFRLHFNCRECIMTVYAET